MLDVLYFGNVIFFCMISGTPNMMKRGRNLRDGQRFNSGRATWLFIRMTNRYDSSRFEGCDEVPFSLFHIIQGV